MNSHMRVAAREQKKPSDASQCTTLFYYAALLQSTGWLKLREEFHFLSLHFLSTQEIATLQRPLPDLYVPLMTRFMLSHTSVAVDGGLPMSCPLS